MLTGCACSAHRCVALQFELGKLVLKRFLLLVLLMDRAATHLSSHYRTPLLFKLAGSIKSSKQVRAATARHHLLHSSLPWPRQTLMLP